MDEPPSGNCKTNPFASNRRRESKSPSIWPRAAGGLGDNVHDGGGAPESPTGIIPESERFGFRQNKRPPENWRIWIGAYKRGDWPGHFSRNTVPIYIADDISHRPPEALGLSNTQESAFVVGELYFYTFSSELIDVVSWWTPDPQNRFLCRIWPSERAVVRWPPTILSDTAIDRASTAFWFHSSKIAPMKR